ncbi:putative LuxR family transcriptional regulator [Gordonia effusa NBRC 100432]|uniref:Putative LuxR family transcriptional regulator n=1 Tax=Gordonia effusa NBRC 100432 TaxID=1077974 RepID=H0R3N6_9ACTN|nr:LuxR C-terminal-related transcriptional regulator [Gordonia effusa]GAB19687.1 putative LuxR family transcriptional regulator [Gordonia effusa NBRC 100432]
MQSDSDTSPTHGDVAATTPVVAVIAEHDILDAAIVALVEKLGYVAVIHDIDTPGARLAGYAVVVVTRSPQRYGLLATLLRYRLATIVGITVSGGKAPTADGIATATGAAQLAAVLSDVANRHQRLIYCETPDETANPRVHLTERELQVLKTYVSGETIAATAINYGITESTVREHYRRVKIRYARAGRTVSNKAHMLLALVDDGWLTTNIAAKTQQIAESAEPPSTVTEVNNA